MTFGKLIRSFTVGMVMALLAIGLMPFLLIFLLSDISGLTDFDSTPIVTVVSKFINGSKFR